LRAVEFAEKKQLEIVQKELNADEQRMKEITDYYRQYEKEYELVDDDEQEEVRDEAGVFKWEEQLPISLKRGISGVFDVVEAVELLKHFKAQDVAVLRIPPEIRYCDYFVVVSVMSNRHLTALQESLRRVYKMKKNRRDPPISLDNRTNNEWRALDLGNIVIHLMTPACRDRYDIETLWAVGPDFDDLTQAQAESTWEALMKEFTIPVSTKNAETFGGEKK